VVERRRRWTRVGGRGGRVARSRMRVQLPRARRRYPARPREAEGPRKLEFADIFPQRADGLSFVVRYGFECQTPSVRCEHEDRSARAPVAAVGWSAKGRGAEEEGEPAAGSARAAREVSQRCAAHHPAPAARGVEPEDATLFRGAAARVRAGLRAVRVPDHPLLGPGQPHPHDRRSSGSAVARPGDEGARGADGPGAEQADGPARAGVRRSLSLAPAPEPARGGARGALRAGERCHPRAARGLVDPSRRGPVLLRGAAGPWPAAGGGPVVVDAARRRRARPRRATRGLSQRGALVRGAVIATATDSPPTPALPGFAART